MKLRPFRPRIRSKAAFGGQYHKFFLGEHGPRPPSWGGASNDEVQCFPGAHNVRYNSPSGARKSNIPYWAKGIQIFGVTESYLNMSIKDTEVRIGGYKIVRNDRKKGSGGGVCIFIRNDLSWLRRRDDLKNHNIEAIWISFQLISFIVFILTGQFGNQYLFSCN